MLKVIRTLLVWLIAGAVFVLIGMVLTVVILVRYGDGVDVLEDLFGGSDGGDVVVVQEMKRINELATVKWTNQVIVTEKGGITFCPDFLEESVCGEEVIVIATSDVRAGIDLDDLDRGDVRIRDGRVSVELPEPEVLSISVDEEKTRLYDRDRGIVVFRGDDALIEEARQAAQDRSLDVAKENGILEQAQTNTEESIEALVRSLGYKEVTFV